MADDLAPYPRWNGYLHDLGECEVETAAKSRFNFYCNSWGNPESPPKLKCRPNQKNSFGWSGNGKAILWGAAAPALCLVVGFFCTRASPAKRSIAVLPFVDLSQAKDQEYFGDGITEQISN